MVNQTDEDIMQYMPLVEKAVRNVKVRSASYQKDDLINMGFIGLMDAMEKFDPSKEVPFENYAYIRIKGSIIDEIRRTSPVPRSQMDRLNIYYETKEDLAKDFGRVPLEEEIRVAMNLTEKQLNGIHQTIHSLADISLDEVLFSEGTDSPSRVDYLVDEDQLGSEELVIAKEQEQLMLQGVEVLAERDQLILQLYYVEELTLKEIAHILDLSIPRISQIHGKILSDLRTFMNKENRED